MLLLCFLLPETFSYTRNIIYNSTASSFIVKSFGFDANGAFDISIHTDKNSSLKSFLITEKDLFQSNALETGLYEYCFDNSLEFSNINYSKPYLSQDYNWRGTIQKRGIYYPIFINCYDNFSIYNINLHFKNPGSLLDYRYNNYFLLYTILSNLYILISIIWFANAFKFSKFSILIFTILSILPPLKAIKNGLNASLWNDRRIIENPSQQKQNFLFFAQFCYYTLFLIVHSFIAFGYGIFYDSLPTNQIIQIIFSSTIITSSFISVEIITTIEAALFSIIGIMIGLLWFAKINISAILIIFDLQRDDELFEDQQVHQKYKLMMHYNIGFYSLLFLGFIFLGVTATNESIPIISDTFFEIVSFLISIYQLFIFYLRKSYEGESIDDTVSFEPNAVFLEEPGSNTELAFIMTPHNDSA